MSYPKGKPAHNRKDDPNSTVRMCKVCAVVKDKKTGFYGAHHKCRSCISEDNKKTRTPGSRYAEWLKGYGLTPESYNEMLEKQGGGCAICGSKDHGGAKRTTRFPVDHCHETGKTRGLLCHRCNRALGFFKDDIQTLQNAVKYLNDHSNSNNSTEGMV